MSFPFLYDFETSLFPWEKPSSKGIQAYQGGGTVVMPARNMYYNVNIGQDNLHNIVVGQGVISTGTLSLSPGNITGNGLINIGNTGLNATVDYRDARLVFIGNSDIGSAKDHPLKITIGTTDDSSFKTGGVVNFIDNVNSVSAYRTALTEGNIVFVDSQLLELSNPSNLNVPVINDLDPRFYEYDEETLSLTFTGTTQTGSNEDDVLIAEYKDFQVMGQGGQDRLYAHEEGTILSGGDDKDRLYGRQGEDNLQGDDGRDKLFGGQGDDYLYGGGDRDILFGADGDDILNGGAGIDRLYGGNGADSFVFSAIDHGVDYIFDFDAAEGDTLDISGILYNAGYDPLEDALADFVQIRNDDNFTTLAVNDTGTGEAYQDIARLYYTGEMNTNVQALVDAGLIETETDFIIIPDFNQDIA